MPEDFVFDTNKDWEKWTKEHKYLGQDNNGMWYLYAAFPQEYSSKDGWCTPMGTKHILVGTSSYLDHFIVKLNYD